MKNILSVLLLTLITSFCYSQAGWYVQTQLTSEELRREFFINSQTGWVFGFLNTIKKTTNGGINWFYQNGNTSESFLGGYFINSQTGWLCGGTENLSHTQISKTTDGGNNWYTKYYHNTNGLAYNIQFYNSITGWASLQNGKILKTIDGGETWYSQISPVISWLSDVHFVDINTGWACGRNGVIIKTISGGFIIPSPPVLLSPPNGSLNINTTPTLTWNSSPFTTHYKVLISTNSNFSLIIDSATVSSNYYNVPNGKLQLGYTYYWKVYASNPYGTSDWSSIWSFSTGQYPEAPILISPPNGTFGTSTTPTLSWTPQANIIYYQVQISTLPNFLTITDSATVTNLEYTVPSGKLFINITYFWRVNATNSFGTGPWSNVWSFISYPTEIKKLNNEIPKEYILYQNHPNPFNSNTKIKFALPQKSKVRIILYDLLGRIINQLINSELNDGVFEYTLNCENLSSGIYFVAMETRGYTHTIKINLIK